MYSLERCLFTIIHLFVTIGELEELSVKENNHIVVLVLMIVENMFSAGFTGLTFVTPGLDSLLLIYRF